MNLGKLKLKNNLIAAPMAGYSDLPWRILVSELGAGMVFSEMISAEALQRAQKRTIKLAFNDKRATPFGIQLFGSKPESFANAISILKDHPFDLVDINMGCPVKKVVARGEGSAIMKSPNIAEAIIKAVRFSYKGPLTVKIRAGWDDFSINAVEIAKIAENSGADGVIVHPRTKMQVFKGSADWKIIADVKNALQIPVIGNGDVIDKTSADKMFAETGCDGIMIGRAAIGNPCVFREINGHAPLTLQEKFNLIKKHIELTLEFKDERHAISVMRKFIPKYLKGMPGHKELLMNLNRAKTIASALEYLVDFM
ncbi:MAG: tRNA dihydrouridine synthase DusB [Deltaproteobacteria bacterium]|nr:tRNA dihydrouridine synthase DusB [Deltaproteobacteria bacterium]